MRSTPQAAQENGKKRDVKLKLRSTRKQTGTELSKDSTCVTQGSRARRVPVDVVELDDQTFRVGDCTYVVLNDAALDGLSDDEEEECVVCGKAQLNGSEMLECGRCLRGFHLCCLDPPLSTVPEVRCFGGVAWILLHSVGYISVVDLRPCIWASHLLHTMLPSLSLTHCCQQDEWVCPDCEAGKQVVPSSATTSRAKVLSDSGLGLARIEALWEVHDKATENSKGKRGGRRSVEKGEEKEYAVTLRWFCIPEQTHVGRQVRFCWSRLKDINQFTTLRWWHHISAAAPCCEGGLPH